MKTKITTLLGIESPVVQGGMAWVAESHLAAAVSNAGGLGIIGAASAPAEWVRAQIQEVKRRTDKPFGVNIMLISYVPKYFDKYGKISSVSGFLNACTYLGSAASSYGFAAIAETSGWSATILIWLFITLAACLLCALGVRKWTKFISKS